MRKTVSKHAKDRFRERTTLGKNSEMVKLFSQAKAHGKSPDYFAGEFWEFLTSRKVSSKNLKVKVFQDKIFLYKHRNLITVYNVPEQFLPTKEHTAHWFKEHHIPDPIKKVEAEGKDLMYLLKFGLIEEEQHGQSNDVEC